MATATKTLEDRMGMPPFPHGFNQDHDEPTCYVLILWPGTGVRDTLPLLIHYGPDKFPVLPGEVNQRE